MQKEKLEQLRIIFAKEIKNLMNEFEIAIVKKVPVTKEEWIDIIVNKFIYEIKIRATDRKE